VGILTGAPEYKFAAQIVARRGTNALGDLTPAQYLGPRRVGLIGGAIQFTATICSTAGPNTEWIFRRRCDGHRMVLRGPPPNNAIAVIQSPEPPVFPDDSFMMDPQPGGQVVDPTGRGRAGAIPVQDRVPTTNSIYDTDAPGFPITDLNLLNRPVGTIFVMKNNFTEWVECRANRGAPWQRASDDLTWHIRKTYVQTAAGAPGTWVAQILPVAETGIVLGVTNGNAGQTFVLPGAPFEIVPGSLQVLIGAALPPAAFTYTPATCTVTIRLARAPGRQVTADFQRPSYNDIGEGHVDINF
jgi:hypothetical protein